MSGDPIKLTSYEGDASHFELGPKVTPGEFKQYFTDKLEELMKQNRRFSLVIDSSNVKVISYEITTYMLNWLKMNREQLGRYLVASSVIVTNGLVKGVFNMVFKVYTPVSPLKLVQNSEDAWNFVASNENK